MSSESERGQVSGSAAEVYERFFVPALFGQWGDPVVALADPPPAARFLDVACGTGVVARAAQRRLGPGGRVTGLDRNPGMLAVARKAAPAADWQEGLAEALPFADASFDSVASQFGIMFFEDRIRALKEMWRVLAPGGRLVVAVWDGLDGSPGYRDMVGLLERLFGRPAAAALEAPFCLGDRADFAALFQAAGIPARVQTQAGEARFPSIEAWVHTDVKGWTLADMIDAAQYRRLQTAAAEALAAYVGADGQVRFAAPAHLAVAEKG